MFRRILATVTVAIASILVSSSAVAALLGTFTFGTLPGSPAAGDLAWITDGGGTTNVGDAAAGGGSGRDLVSWDAGQARWEFVTRIPATVPPAALEKFLAAVRIDYNNTGSGASATDVQAALDELFAGAGGAGTAAELAYDNSTSGLTAENAQDALDEIDAAVDGLGSIDALTFRSLFNSGGTSMQVAWGDQICLIPNAAEHMSTGLLCTTANRGDEIVFSRALTITEISFTTTQAISSSLGGCAFRLTLDSGVTGISGTQLNVPSTNATATIGTEFSTGPISIAIPARTAFKVQVSNGPNCPGGSGCQCSSGFVAGSLEIWGVLQ